MIKIDRAAEPPKLVAVRDAHLQRARAARLAGSPVVFAAYDLVKPALAEMQHHKCCYCEKPEEQAKYRDVEHYRPKSLYWWLAWTWENLLFSCVECNREYKANQFPRVAGDRLLVAEEAPPGAEQPLLLDPSAPSFAASIHIEFRPDKVQGQERWQPYGLTEHGRKTIEVCGLDRPGLLTLYKDHVNHCVRPKIEVFMAEVEKQNAQQVVAAWSRMTRGLLAPARPFRALARDAINRLVSSTIRVKYQLELAEL